MSSTTDELQRSWKEDPENKTKLFRYMKAMEREGQHLSIPESFRIALLLSPDVSQLEYNMHKDVFDKIRFMIDDVSTDEAKRYCNVIFENRENIKQTPESRLIATQLKLATSKESEYFNGYAGQLSFISAFANLEEDEIITNLEYHRARSIVQHRASSLYEIYEIEHNTNENLAVLPALAYFIKRRLIEHPTQPFEIVHSESLRSIRFFGLSLIRYSKSLFSMNQWINTKHNDKMEYLSILKILGPYARAAINIVEKINIKNDDLYIPYGIPHLLASITIKEQKEIRQACNEAIRAMTR